MNTYKLDLTGGGQGVQDAEHDSVLKILAYMSMFGQNISFQQSPINKNDTATDVLFGAIQGVPADDILLNAPVITFDLGFSLSNLAVLDTLVSNVALNDYYLLSTLVYDTNSQNVIEYVDKPYAVKNYMAVSMFDPTALAPKSQPAVDLDAYKSLKIATDFGAGVTITQIFIGLCNSSKTDFYTPFENSPTVFFDLTNKKIR